MPPTGRKRRTAAHCTEPCCEPACFDASECCDDPACTKPDKCPEEACCGNSCGPRPRLERRGRAGASLVTAACLACVAVLAMAPTRVAASGGGDLRPGFVVCDAEGNCEFSPELLHEYCNEREVDDFNMGLHVGAIFIQIGVSLIGTMIPVLTRKYGGTRIGDYEFSLFKHLGAGIILSTGFIHMLPPAFENLTNVCLSDGWLEYTAYAGLLAMLSILFTQFIQTAAVSYLRNSNDLKGDHRVAANGNGSHSSWSPIASPSSGVPSKAPTPDSGDSADSDSVIVDTTRGDGNDVEMALHQAQHHLHHHSRRQHDHDHDGDAAEVEHVHSLILAHRQRRQVMVYILELGIATHSFIIGLALGVSRGTELTALMIALAFHQFFEGMALSATVMDAGFKTSLQIIFAVVFYSTTTPLGIAIGIAIESQFNANSPAALVSTGVVEAVSAGILIYDSCVNMISANMTNSASFVMLPLPKKFGAFLALWVGVTVMSVIGKWA